MIEYKSYPISGISVSTNKDVNLEIVVFLMSN